MLKLSEKKYKGTFSRFSLYKFRKEILALKDTTQRVSEWLLLVCVLLLVLFYRGY